MGTFIPVGNGGNRREFVAHPAGRFLAVCADVYFLERLNNYYGVASKLDGKIDNYKTRNVLRIVFLTLHPTEDGKPSYVSQEFTASDNDKSNLYKFIVAWHPEMAGVKLSGIDLDVLIGSGADIMVTNKTTKDGHTFAGVSLALGLRAGDPIVEIPSDFKRADVRKKQEWEDKEINKRFPDWKIRYVDAQPGPSLSGLPVGKAAPVATASAAAIATVQGSLAQSARPVFAASQRPTNPPVAGAEGVAPIAEDHLPF